MISETCHPKRAVAQIGVRVQDQSNISVHESVQPTINDSKTLKQEPYYSSKDITILHAIVSSAQEKLDQSPDPKPLPAAVLFKAYDDVLPTFGLDPDSDHHLSALVFRIGGEHGSGSLLDNFQAILKRMGIVLEFRDNISISEQSRSSTPLSSPQREFMRPSPLKEQNPRNNDKSGEEPPRDYVPPETFNAPKRSSHAQTDAARKAVPNGTSTTTLPELRCRVQSTATVQLDHALADPSANELLAASPNKLSADHDAIARFSDQALALQKHTLVSVIDRWRNAASKGSNAAGPKVAEIFNHNLFNLKRRNFTEGQTTAMDSRSHPLTVDGNSLQTRLLLEVRAASDPESPEQDSFLSRATRARQIFLASKVFNRWANQTAIRLEREYVARRHMVRFRCFNSWNHAPTSESMQVSILRATTAIRKLRRTIACHEDWLHQASAFIKRTHLHRKASYMLNYWSTVILARSLVQTSNARTKAEVVTNWLRQARTSQSLHVIAGKISQILESGCVITKWIGHVETNQARIAAARKLGFMVKASFWLHKWRDRTRLTDHAEACRRLQALDNSKRAFQIWRLGTRLEGFQWKLACAAVSTQIDKWVATTRLDAEQEAISSRHHKAQSAVILSGRLRSMGQGQVELDRLAERAQWYIRATGLLDAMQSYAKHRKHEAKLAVRRYLMMRYTENSSRKRRRIFYSALDDWQSHATKSAEIARLVNQHRASSVLRRNTAISTRWRRHALQMTKLHSVALDRHAQRRLHEWLVMSAADDQQQARALQSWAMVQQHQTLKRWTISTLQRGGQAHSAKVIRQRHEREYRHRSLHGWKRAVARSSSGAAPVFEPPSPALTEPASSSRKFTKSFPTRRPLLRRLEDESTLRSLMQTPSRSTGLVFASSQNLPFHIMDSVEEGERESVDSVNLDAGGPSRRNQSSRSFRAIPPNQLASTTPRAPLPVRVQSSTRDGLTTPGRRGQQFFAKSTQTQSSPTKSGQAAHTPFTSRRNRIKELLQPTVTFADSG